MIEFAKRVGEQVLYFGIAFFLMVGVATTFFLLHVWADERRYDRLRKKEGTCTKE